MSKNITINKVVEEMEQHLKRFSLTKKRKNLIPFLETYYLVTKRVADKYQANQKYYDNYPKLQRLDVVFAALYLRPEKKYLKSGKSNSAWDEYYLYCGKPGIAFVQMLLGINTHINADLAVALKSANYHERRDFLKINKILEEVIPQIMLFLVKNNHDIFAFGGLVFRKFMLNEFHDIIVRWREDAWHNSKKIKNQKDIKILAKKTALVSKELQEIFGNFQQLKNIQISLNHLHHLRVRL